MASERLFSTGERFKPFSYNDPDSGKTLVSPFPVAVIGINQEKLGVGSLIGCTFDDGWDGNPVIELVDPSSPSGKVEILGAECWWAPLNDTELAEEVVEEIAEQAQTIMPATLYIQVVNADLN